MLEKLKDRDGNDFEDGADYFLTASSINKINACIDVVNGLVEQLHRLVDTQIVDGGDEDERKWIGKLCKFRDCEDCGWQYGILTDIVVGNDYPYWMGNLEFAECQPVLEEEFKDVIYKRA